MKCDLRNLIQIPIEKQWHLEFYSKFLIPNSFRTSFIFILSVITTHHSRKTQLRHPWLPLQFIPAFNMLVSSDIAPFLLFLWWGLQFFSDLETSWLCQDLGGGLNLNFYLLLWILYMIVKVVVVGDIVARDQTRCLSLNVIIFFFILSDTGYVGYFYGNLT